MKGPDPETVILSLPTKTGEKKQSFESREQASNLFCLLLKMIGGEEDEALQL